MNINLSLVKDAIRRGNLSDSILQLLQITREYVPRFHNEVVLHSAGLQQIRTDQRKGIASSHDARLEKNRIANALLDLIDDLDQEFAIDQAAYVPNTLDRKGDGKMIKILFLAANPSDTTRLRLDKESRAIEQALRQSEFRDRFDIRQHWAVRGADLQGHLLRHKPDIVHFSGHGSSSSEIILEDMSGYRQAVSVRALSRLFSVLKDNIRCVVLNACYSEQQALAIAEHIDCVVGMSRAIGDSAAISFAAAFYQALGFGRDVKAAFDLGCVQIDLEGLNEQDTPKLVAVQSNPEELIFVHDS